jgi:hypothetical protein
MENIGNGLVQVEERISGIEGKMRNYYIHIAIMKKKKKQS